MTAFELIESPPDDEGVVHYSVAASPALQAEEAGDALPRSPGGRHALPPVRSTEHNPSTETNQMFDQEIKTPEPEGDGAPKIFHDSGKLAALRPPLQLGSSRDEPAEPPAAPHEKDEAEDAGADKNAKRKASRHAKAAASVDPLLVTIEAQVDELGRLGREVLSTWNRGHRNLYEALALGVKVYEDTIDNPKLLAKAVKGANVKPAKSGETALNKILLPIFQTAFGVVRKVKGVESTVERANLAKKTSDYALAAAEAIAGGVTSTGLADFLTAPGNGINKLAKAHRLRLRVGTTKRAAAGPTISSKDRVCFAEVGGLDALRDGTFVLLGVRAGDGRLVIKHCVSDDALTQLVVEASAAQPAVPPGAG